MITPPLTAKATPHLKTEDLITEMAEIAKVVAFDFPTILQEEHKDPVLRSARSSVKEGTSSHPKAPAIRQSKGLLRYCQKLDKLMKETLPSPVL